MFKKATLAVIAVLVVSLFPQIALADCSSGHAYTYSKLSDGTYSVTCETCGSSVDQNRTILYTSVDNVVVNPTVTSNFGDLQIVSNTNVSGCGVMVFNKELTIVPKLCFYKKGVINETMKSIILPNSVITIGDWAFYYMKNLEHIELGNSLQEVKQRGLCTLQKLDELILPKTLQTAGINAFANTRVQKKIIFHSIPCFTDGGISVFYNADKVSFELTDDSYIYADEDQASFSANSASYIHSISNQWGSAIVPFKVMSNEAVKLYGIEILVGSSQKVMLKEINEVPANTPFIYKKLNSSDTSVEFTISSGSLVAPTQSAYSGDTIDGFHLVGTYADTLVSSTSGETSYLHDLTLQKTSSSTVSPFGVWMNKIGSSSVNEFTLNDVFGVIYYKSKDGNLISLASGAEFLDSDSNTLTIVRNDYSEKGSLLFDAPVASIGANAFKNLSNLKEIELPASVTSIGNSAFESCSNLDKVTLSEGLITVGNNVFKGTKLYSVSIPATVSSLGSSCFEGCSTLATIEFLGTGLTQIGQNTFFNCTNLNNVQLPAGVSTIAGSAFEGCTSLATISLPSSLRTIGERAFYGCTGLGAISLPDKLTTINANAFNGCTSLSEMTIPNYVTSVGNEAFVGCTSLSKCVFIAPSRVTTLGDGAFAGCTSLQSISLPTKLKKISPWLFSSCTGLQSVIIGDDVTSIDNGAFYGCNNSKFTAIDMPEDLTTLGDVVFDGCSYLKTVQFYQNLRQLSNNPFNSCERLVNVNFKSYPYINKDIFTTCPSARLAFDLSDDSYISNNCPIWSNVKVVSSTGTYTRNMTSEWGTAILPFKVVSNDDIQCYVLSNIEDGSMIFSPVESVNANTPFVFQKKDDEANQVSMSGTGISSITNSTYSSSAVGNWTMKGAFSDQSLSDIYFISKDQWWKTASGVSVNLKKFRGWFKNSGSDAASFRILVEQSGNETAILEIAEDGSVKDSTEGVYDLRGNKLDAPIKGQINIINGKKVFIK